MQIPNLHSPSPTQNMTGNAFFPANDDFLLQQLQQQIDFYFSSENLCRDDYLRSFLYQNNGAVPVEIIASFPMIKKIVARAFLGPAAVFQTDPMTLPPADCNLIRHAVALNSQTVMVEGMFFVHPEYRMQQHYATTAPYPHNTTPQGRFAPVQDQDMNHHRHTSPVPPQPYEQMKRAAGDETSTRTSATVSPTSFASTLNPSADEHDDHKSYITVHGILDNISNAVLKKWLAFHERVVPKGLVPVFPLSLEKVRPQTWKLSFSTESEAHAAMEVISQRKFKYGDFLTCQFEGGGGSVGGGSPTSAMPVAMMYQPVVFPHGDQVYYASAYPQSVLETAQKGMVALPYSSAMATPVYAWAYSPTPVTPAATPAAVTDKEHVVQEIVANAPSTQEENVSIPPPPSDHQHTPDPRSRRKTHNRNKKSRSQKKNHHRKQKMDEFPPLAESPNINAEKNGDCVETVLLETTQKMGEMNLNKDRKKDRSTE